MTATPERREEGLCAPPLRITGTVGARDRFHESAAGDRLLLWCAGARAAPATARSQCHGHSTGGGRFLRPAVVVDPSHRCSPLKESRALTIGAVALRKRARRRLRGPADPNAIVRPAPGRDDRRDSDVADAIADRPPAQSLKRSSAATTAGSSTRPRGHAGRGRLAVADVWSGSVHFVVPLLIRPGAFDQGR